MVDVGIVNYKKPVVALLVCMQFYRRVLEVVFLQIEAQPVTDSMRIDIGFHAVTPFAEHHQDRFVHIVVYQ